MASTIAEFKAGQAAVELYDQVDQISTAMQNLKFAVDRASGFKSILLNNAEVETSATMLGEVSTHADSVWGSAKSDLQSILDVIAGMIPNPDVPGSTHTRETLLDSLKAD
jgi:hypothetical protein